MELESFQVAVVDDEESVRTGLGRMLRWAGMQVETFASGEDLLVSGLHPDCVVLDLHMPEMSGFEVWERLTKMENPVSVVVITGHDTSENQKRALGAGASAYLTKPVDGDVLIKAITAAISNRGVSREA